jgi:hypothetical protein
LIGTSEGCEMRARAFLGENLIDEAVLTNLMVIEPDAFRYMTPAGRVGVMEALKAAENNNGIEGVAQ